MISLRGVNNLTSWSANNALANLGNDQVPKPTINSSLLDCKLLIQRNIVYFFVQWTKSHRNFWRNTSNFSKFFYLCKAFRPCPTSRSITLQSTRANSHADHNLKMHLFSRRRYKALNQDQQERDYPPLTIKWWNFYFGSWMVSPRPWSSLSTPPTLTSIYDLHAGTTIPWDLAG